MKFNRNKLLILILIFTAVSVALIGSAFADNEIVFDGEEIKSEYGYYSEFFAPLRYVKSGGEEFETKAVLTFPGGRMTSYGGAILDELGEYTLEYFADVDGTVYTETHKFDVTITSKDLWTGDTTEFIASNNAKVNPYNESGAVLLSAYAKTEIRYLNELYLGDNTLSDDVMTFVVAPQPSGYCETKTFYVVIEDSSDSSNRIYVKFYRKSYDLEKDRKSVNVCISLDGENYSEAKNITKSSMCGVIMGGGDSLPITISMDAQERILRVTCDSNTYDFDLNTEIVVGSGEKWKGFSDGWAYVYAGFKDRLTSGASSVAVYTVDGVSLNGKDVTLSEAPEVTVSSEKMVSGVMYAAQGGKHTFIDAKAVCRVQGELGIADVVVYRVNGDVTSTVYAGIDGFVPSEAGTYRVEYISEKNYLGVQGKASYELIVLSKEESAIEYEFGAFEDTYTAGEEITIPEHEVSGGRGEIEVTYEVEVGEKTLTISDGVFLAEYTGEYTIKAICVDDIQTVEFTKTISVKANSEKYIDVSGIPTKVIAGDTIDLSVIDAYKFTESGKTALETTVKVGGKAVSGKYTFKDAGVVELTITAESIEKIVAVTVIKPDSNTENQYIKDFFDFDKDKIDVNNSDIKFNFTEDVEIKFIRPLGRDFFFIEFTVISSEANFENLELTFTDSLDPSNSVKFYLSKGGNDTAEARMKSVLTYLGKTYTVGGSFVNAVGQYSFIFEYDEATKALIDNTGSVVLNFTKTTSGKAFEGFDGDIYVSIKANGVSAESAVKIKKILNQNIKKKISATNANFGPEIIVTEKVSSGYLNEKYTLPSVIACDALETVSGISVKVSSPSGKVVLTSDKIEDLSFTPEEKGDYVAEYTATDANGNKNVESVTISIIDKEAEDFMVGGTGVSSADVVAPVVTIGSKPTVSVKVGETFSIAKITATDNVTELSKMKLYVYVIAPDGVRTMVCSAPTKTTVDDTRSASERLALITDASADYLKFTPSFEGTYRVYYVVTDGNDLTTIARYNVEVTK